MISLINEIFGKFTSYELRVDPQTKDLIYIIELTPEQAQFLRNNFNEFHTISVIYELMMSCRLRHPVVEPTKFCLTPDNFLIIQGSLFVIKEIVSRI